MADMSSGAWVTRAQGPSFAIALLGSVVAGGTIGYMLIEHWTLWDAFYMTVITVTTVGYKEVHTMSRAGEAFTVVLLFGGVGSALYVFTLLATVVVEGGLPKRLEKHRRSRMLDALKDHFIVCGYGRMGRLIAAQLRHENVPFVIIELDPAHMMEALQEGMLAVEADASKEDVLKRVGIQKSRALIAALGTDAQNVYTVLSARVLRPDLFVVARAEAEDSMQKLLRAGANRVVLPYQIGATQIVQSALRPAVVDFVQLATNSRNIDLAMEEVAISRESPLANRTVLYANLQQRYGVIVIGIQREDQRMDFNPEPSARVKPGDKLVVLGRPHALKELAAEAAS